MKFAALLLALASGAAQAQFWSGNDLLQKINGSADDMIWALGYVSGVADAGQNRDFCIPSGVRVSQVRDMVRDSLQRSPEYRHLDASIFVTLRLVNQWPCKKKQKGTDL